MCRLTQVSAQTGTELAADNEQGSFEFCTIALHITVVVNRA